MPYAQQHYPFENGKEFEECFPADFIAEGIDQTRGWFYTLIVLSTALFGKPPFKNLIANGLVLASDGQKMSKRKKNYPDPMEIVSKYGADALRLYLISSPVVRAENLRFKEEGVRDVIKDVLLPWYNAFRFLMQSIDCYVQEYKKPFFYSEAEVNSTNIMDRWILSFTQSLLDYVRKEMALYHLYNVVPRLTKYIDYLTNWYVRMNRKRLKGENGHDDCKQALLTLYNILFNIIKMMSPFAPFLSETMYRYIKQLTETDADSVHYLMLPQPNQKLINPAIERSVAHMQSVIELGRVIRDRKTVPIKYPLPEVVVVHQDAQYISDVKSLEEYILSELNVRRLTVTTDKSVYGITLRAEPDHKILGVRLKNDFKNVTAAIKSLTDKEINEMVAQGYRQIAGHRVELSEVRLIFKSDDLNSGRYEVHSDNDVLVLLDVTPDSSMQDEGTAREIINRVQKLRKKAHLVPTDEIKVFYQVTGDLERVADDFKSFIESTIKASFEKLSKRCSNDLLIIEETQQLKNCTLYLALTKYTDVQIPTVRWANLQLVNINSHYCNGSKRGVVLLETHKARIALNQLKLEIKRLFGLENDFVLLTKDKLLLDSEERLSKLTNDTVFVTLADDVPTILPESNGTPFCKVLNFDDNGVKGTVILENPVGIVTVKEQDLKKIVKKWVE